LTTHALSDITDVLWDEALDDSNYDNNSIRALFVDYSKSFDLQLGYRTLSTLFVLKFAPVCSFCNC